MKKTKYLLVLLLTVMFVPLIYQRFENRAINNIENEVGLTTTTKKMEVTRNIDNIDFDNIGFKQWDIEQASRNIKKQSQKPYTIMVYMNGSDLESENGAATDDLIQMLESGIRPQNANIILFTGGTKRWQNNVIPSNNCMIWKINGTQLEELAAVGLVNMGDAGTLSSFIDFSVKNFPAEKFGLILWDHGGGSIAGYGQDEKFQNSNLTLLEMNYAFERSVLKNNKLEFLGFDSCLMASIEMAVVASDYAKYLVASEDTEPEEGWDYSFLSEINNNPGMDGGTLGKAIADYYLEFYGNNLDVEATLSVTDLSKVGYVMEEMGNLMSRCSTELLTDKEPTFETFSRKRYATKTFGEGTPRDNDCDMVDIGDMVSKLSDIFPEETGRVQNALEQAVIYNRHNSDADLKGLSTYYIYGGKNIADKTLEVYDSLEMNEEYTAFLYNFAGILNSNKSKAKRRSSLTKEEIDYDELAQSLEMARIDYTMWKPLSKDNGNYIMVGIKNTNHTDLQNVTAINKEYVWPVINGENVCLYEISSSKSHAIYSIPANVNGYDADIMILINDRYPKGKIMGIRQDEGLIIQKGFDEIKNGDKIALYYTVRSFVDNNAVNEWILGKEFTVNGELSLNWVQAETDNIKYCYLLTDLHQNQWYTKFE